MLDNLGADIAIAQNRKSSLTTAQNRLTAFMLQIRFGAVLRRLRPQVEYGPRSLSPREGHHGEIETRYGPCPDWSRIVQRRMVRTGRRSNLLQGSPARVE